MGYAFFKFLVKDETQQTDPIDQWPMEEKVVGSTLTKGKISSNEYLQKRKSTALWKSLLKAFPECLQGLNATHFFVEIIVLSRMNHLPEFVHLSILDFIAIIAKKFRFWISENGVLSKA